MEIVGNFKVMRRVNQTELKPIREENAKELEKFADVIKSALINLQENNRAADLEARTVCIIILEKLPETLLSQYIHWVKKKKKKKKNNGRVSDCYSCLGRDHLGGKCARIRVCNIDGFRDIHSRLLHCNRNGTNCQFRSLESQLDKGTQSQETQPQANQLQATQPQLTRTQGRQEILFNTNDNTMAQGTKGKGSTVNTEGDANINLTTLKFQETTQTDKWQCKLFQQS